MENFLLLETIMVSYAFTGIPFSKVTQVPSIEAILSLLPQLNFPQTINTFGRLEGKIKLLFNGKRQNESQLTKARYNNFHN